MSGINWPLSTNERGKGRAMSEVDLDLVGRLAKLVDQASERRRTQVGMLPRELSDSRRNSGLVRAMRTPVLFLGARRHRPELPQLVVDRQKYFIEMPSVAESSAAGTNPLGVHRPKLQTPHADALIADCDAALSHHLFDVSVAECKSKIKPCAMTDDFGRESAMVIQRFRWAHAA